MKVNIWNVTFAALWAMLASYFNLLAVPIFVLLGVMVLDYVTGMVKAYMASELCSRTGIRGALKKLCYMVMVAAGAVVDYLLQGALVQAGVDLHIELFFGLLVAIWLIINELISILENLAAIGVPGFPALAKIIQRLKNTVSRAAEAEAEDPEEDTSVKE